MGNDQPEAREGEALASWCDMTALANRSPWAPTASLASVWTEAIRVCLDAAGHDPPRTRIQVRLDDQRSVRMFEWEEPSDREKRTHHELRDTVCDAAYGIALATLADQLSLLPHSRADIGSGSDWYVVPEADAPQVTGENFLDHALRVEVSGTMSHRPGEPTARLTQKVDQIRNGNSEVPGYAVVFSAIQPVVLAEQVGSDS